MAYDFSILKKRAGEINEWLGKEYAGIRTGRATGTILDTLQVEAYGSYMPINQVANITIEDSKTLRITPWDNSVVKSIEKAIVSSNLGLSASVDEKGVRLMFPDLTSERREALVKIAKEKLEDARVELRKERNTIMNDLEAKKKSAELGEDEMMRHKAEAEKIIQEAMKKFEEHFTKKEQEITS